MSVEPGSELGGPARQILSTLARMGEATITELVDSLGVTTTAIRQQVNRMVADDWLLCRKRRGGPGRPADVFSLTDKARQWFGQSAEHLCRLILEELADVIGPEQTREILTRVSARMAADLQAQVAASGSVPSVEAVAAALNAQGILAESSGGTRLTVFTCPFPDLAPDHPEVCEVERAAVSQLVGGPVKLDCCRGEGPNRCDFIVEKPTCSASGSGGAGGFKEESMTENQT